MITRSTKHYHTEGSLKPHKSPLFGGSTPNGVNLTPFKGGRVPTEYSSEPIVGVSEVRSIGDRCARMSLYGTPSYGMEEDTIYHDAIKERVLATTEFGRGHGAYYRDMGMAYEGIDPSLIEHWMNLFQPAPIVDKRMEIIQSYGRMAGKIFHAKRLEDWLPVGSRLDIRV